MDEGVRGYAVSLLYPCHSLSGVWFMLDGAVGCASAHVHGAELAPCPAIAWHGSCPAIVCMGLVL
jgi:hypothetical protein